MNPEPGRLVLVATPLGNLGDISPRAKEAMEQAEAWVVEDTRVSGKLQAVLGVRKTMHTLNDHTSDSKLRQLLQSLEGGADLALLTDAGTPGISDPGADLVDLCYQNGIEVDSIPGPSAVPLALSLSGFFAQRFAFLGFLPRKPGEAKSVLEPFIDSTLTVVLFESPFRVTKTLALLATFLPDRRYAVARELTKQHQQIYRGTFPALPTLKDVPEKGEFTLVIEGKRRKVASIVQ